MDANYLNRLVHPIHKTPLAYNEQSAQLTDAAHHDTFEIKEQVPILLTATVDEALTETDLHTKMGSNFQYKEHYQEDAVTYDYFKETENATEREEHNRLHQYILSQIPAGADWILDAGCGGGWLALALKGKNKHVISMDISDINPIKATKNVVYPTHYGLVADAFELPLKEGSIDCIIASEIIEHVPDPKRFLESLFSALKPGGRLIITTPYNERIQYSLCIHCNRLTPHNAHLHSFTEASISKYLPGNAKNSRTTVFNNKILVRLGVQRLLKFMPIGLWKIIERMANSLTKKRAYRLMLVMEK
jgi:2-polyprenyl-3-methyl-5-hydroxy-6-metoxy-1,4-benzoquinol methylase